jgi:hypothetical protein
MGIDGQIYAISRSDQAITEFGWSWDDFAV